MQDMKLIYSVNGCGRGQAHSCREHFLVSFSSYLIFIFLFCSSFFLPSIYSCLSVFLYLCVCLAIYFPSFPNFFFSLSFLHPTSLSLSFSQSLSLPPSLPSLFFSQPLSLSPSLNFSLSISQSPSIPPSLPSLSPSLFSFTPSLSPISLYHEKDDFIKILRTAAAPLLAIYLSGTKDLKKKSQYLALCGSS